MMLSPDLALALLVNRTTQAYTSAAPAYMTYREQTHISAPTLGRTQNINRSVAVRVADNLAVMHDLPRGARRMGEAFPIIPYFDPLSQFSFGYFANLKSIDITLTRGNPLEFPIPLPNPSVTMVVPYASFWDPTYAADSAPGHLHFLIAPTPRITGFYPSEIVENPQTRLPARIALTDTQHDMTIVLDFSTVDGHWLITHGVFSATEHAAFLTFPVIADVTFDHFAFPTTPPSASLVPSPSPLPSPASSPAPTASPSSAASPQAVQSASPSPLPRPASTRRPPRDAFKKHVDARRERR